MAKTAVANQPNRAKNGIARKSGATAKSAGGVKKTKKKDTQHVVEQDGHWVVKSARSGKFVTEPFADKREAIDAGKRLARSLGSDLLVHGTWNQIFQHSPAASQLPEGLIRKAIRSAQGSASKKTASPKTLKKAVAKKK